MKRHSHHALGRGIGELFATGLVQAINRRTYEITHLTVDEYVACERAGLLDGYLLRLGRVQAEACAADMLARAMSCN